LPHKLSVGKISCRLPHKIRGGQSRWLILRLLISAGTILVATVSTQTSQHSACTLRHIPALSIGAPPLHRRSDSRH
jgi:hypothetical protein